MNKQSMINLDRVAKPHVETALDCIQNFINPQVQKEVQEMNNRYRRHYFRFVDESGVKVVKVYNKHGLLATIDANGPESDRLSENALSYSIFRDIWEWISGLCIEVSGLGYIPLESTAPFDFLIFNNPGKY